jgi:hypothetical protein
MSLAVGIVVPAGVAEPQVTNIGQADELLFLCANLGKQPPTPNMSLAFCRPFAFSVCLWPLYWCGPRDGSGTGTLDGVYGGSSDRSHRSFLGEESRMLHSLLSGTIPVSPSTSPLLSSSSPSLPSSPPLPQHRHHLTVCTCRCTAPSGGQERCSPLSEYNGHRKRKSSEKPTCIL